MVMLLRDYEFKEKHSLMILSTQRSGSTLLCRDIAGLNSIGSPDEYFLPLLASKKSDSARIDKFLRSGNKFNSDYYAINLMYNYLHQFGAWVATGKFNCGGRNRKSDALYAIDFFNNNFDNKIFVYIERTSLFDQALSRYRSHKSNVFHLTSSSKIISGFSGNSYTEKEIIEQFDFKEFMEYCNLLLIEKRNCARIVTESEVDWIHLKYEEVVNNYPDYLRKITNAAGFENITLVNKTRGLKKVISQEFYDQIKERFNKEIGLE